MLNYKLGQPVTPYCKGLSCPAYPVVLALSNLQNPPTTPVCSEEFCTSLHSTKNCFVTQKPASFLEGFTNEKGQFVSYASDIEEFVYQKTEEPKVEAKEKSLPFLPFELSDVSSVTEETIQTKEAPNVIPLELASTNATPTKIADLTPGKSDHSLLLARLDKIAQQITKGKVSVPGTFAAAKDQWIRFLNPAKEDPLGWKVFYSSLESEESLEAFVREFTRYFSEFTVTEHKEGCSTCEHVNRMRSSTFCWGCRYNDESIKAGVELKSKYKAA